MADAVTSQTIIDTEKRVVMKFTNLSDGNGESAVKKVDVSALTAHPDGTACSNITIDQIWYDIGGMRLAIYFAASTNALALTIGGSAAAPPTVRAEESKNTVVLPSPSDSTTIFITTRLSFSCKTSGPVTVSAIIPP